MLLRRGVRAPDNQPVRQRAWFWYVAGGVVVTAAYLFIPGWQVGPLFNVIAISSPIAIVIAVRVWKPQTRLPWYLFALGQTLFVAGDVITYNYERFFGTDPAVPVDRRRLLPLGLSMSRRGHPVADPAAQPRR